MTKFNAHENSTPFNDEMSVADLILKIKNYLQFLRSKWKVIVFVSVLGALIGLVYSFFSKPIYKAELSFALEDDKSSGGLGAAMGFASQFGIDLGGGSGGGAFSGDNLAALMKSRSIMEKTLLTTIDIGKKEQTLAELYIDFNHLRKQWSGDTALNKLTFLRDADRSTFTLKQDSVLGAFCEAIAAKNLTVDKLDKKTSITTVQVKSTNELFSKFFAEILVNTVSNFYIDTKTKRSVQNVNILQRQTDSVRQELNRALAGVASSADINPNANPTLQILRVPSQKRQVDVQANQAILTQLVSNLEISKMSLRKETPLIQIIDKPILPLEKEIFGKKKGILVGGFIAAMLTILVISVSNYLKKTMS